MISPVIDKAATKIPPSVLKVFCQSVAKGGFRVKDPGETATIGEGFSGHLFDFILRREAELEEIPGGLTFHLIERQNRNLGGLQHEGGDILLDQGANDAYRPLALQRVKVS